MDFNYIAHKILEVIGAIAILKIFIEAIIPHIKLMKLRKQQKHKNKK